MRVDGIIILLIIFGIFNAITSKNKKKAEEAKRKAAIPQSAAPPRPQPKPAPQPAAGLHTELEGYSSFEGESHEEHAEHLRRIEEEEAQRRQEREALDDLREANLDRLRAAVVMSEVLGKPVSLRPRVGYHR